MLETLRRSYVDVARGLSILIQSPCVDVPKTVKHSTPEVGPVHVVELRAPEIRPERAAGATYLDADLEPLVSPAVVSFRRQPAGSVRFVRGDVDADGSTRLVDVIVHLDALFRRGPLPCRRAADVNGDDRMNLLDTVLLLGVLFGRTEELPAPWPECGSDPGRDGLSCTSFPACAAP